MIVGGLGNVRQRSDSGYDAAETSVEAMWAEVGGDGLD